VILIPPHEHPFSVRSVSEGQIDVLSVRGERISFPAASTYVWLTAPPLHLHEFFRLPQADEATPVTRARVHEPEATTPPCQFRGLDLFTFDPDDIAGYFRQTLAEQPHVEEAATQPEAAPPAAASPPDAEHLLADQVADPAIRRAILQCIGKAGTAPSTREDLIIYSRRTFFTSNYSYEFQIGFGHVSIPNYSARFVNWSRIDFEHLGVPDLIVNVNGHSGYRPADQICHSWLDEQLLPISGPKSCHYILFVDSAFSISEVENFMLQFSDVYAQLGFGRLVAYRRSDWLKQVTADSFQTEVQSFIEANPLTEFQLFPVLAFVVGNLFLDSAFDPHLFMTHIHHIERSTRLDFESLAFRIYSRVRICETAQHPPFFVFPYDVYRPQPPFLLRRTGDHLSLHIIWDEQTQSSCWSDDIGSILLWISKAPLDRIRTIVDRATRTFGADLRRITFAALAEGLTKEQIGHIVKVLGPGLDIFVLAPAPAVQARFTEDFCDDVVVFDDGWNDGPFEQPLAACYVMSKRLPSYKCAIYRGGGRDALANYAQQMSHLSWMSVKPGNEERTISYPPHLCSLLAQGRGSVFAVARFEFLPTPDLM
jgi:hypothetical protein